MENENGTLELQQMYQEFLNNYKKLNNTFELTDILEIYLLYIKLLYSGYLSINKEFEKTSDLKFMEIELLKDLDCKNGNFDNLLGVYILTGEGVCRHIAANFRDILNNLDIESYSLICLYKSGGFKNRHLFTFFATLIDPTIKEKLNVLFHLIKKDTSYFQKEKLIKVMEYLCQEYELEETKKGIIFSHAITYAIKDNKSYLFDPTLNRVINKLAPLNSFSSSYVLCNHNFDGVINYETFIEDFNIYPPFNFSSDKLKYEVQIINELFRKNKDIFNKFYNDNSEIYREIYNILNNYDIDFKKYDKERYRGLSRELRKIDKMYKDRYLKR